MSKEQMINYSMVLESIVRSGMRYYRQTGSYPDGFDEMVRVEEARVVDAFNRLQQSENAYLLQAQQDLAEIVAYNAVHMQQPSLTSAAVASSSMHTTTSAAHSGGASDSAISILGDVILNTFDVFGE